LGKSQSAEDKRFIKFVGKKYRLPEDLRTNCSWMYAIVRVKTNKDNKIISYDFINNLSEEMKASFGILIGYQFSQKMKINGHPIIFYLLVDNSEVCIPKKKDASYTPDQVFNFMITNFDKIQKTDPRAIVISTPAYTMYYPTQKKE
jgi:hypothetical protein